MVTDNLEERLQELWQKIDDLRGGTPPIQLARNVYRAKRRAPGDALEDGVAEVLGGLVPEGCIVLVNATFRFPGRDKPNELVPDVAVVREGDPWQVVLTFEAKVGGGIVDKMEEKRRVRHTALVGAECECSFGALQGLRGIYGGPRVLVAIGKVKRFQRHFDGFIWLGDATAAAQSIRELEHLLVEGVPGA